MILNMLRKTIENTELLEKINKALEELIADGSVQQILDKYINAD